MSKKFLYLISIIIACFIFANRCSAAGPIVVSTDITEATTWTKNNSPYIVNRFINITAPLTIEAGTVIKFSDIFPIPGSAPGFAIKNSFNAVGNLLDKIVFTSACDPNYGGETWDYCSPYSKKTPSKGQWGNLTIDGVANKNNVVFDYIKIFYANIGIKFYASDSTLHKNVSITHGEISNCQLSGIFIQNTLPVMDSLVLSNNYDGVQVYSSVGGDVIPKIRNSAIFGNRNGVNGTGAGTASDVDARYNWWGDVSGPYYNYGYSKEPSNLEGKGNRVIGSDVLFRPWDQSDPTIPKEPVVFVPGIGASINPDLMISGVMANNWTMFDHTYDGIIAAFKSMGYEEGKNFFIAYYDWRKSNGESAQQYLKPTIQKALSNSEATKVNIVTHSMGSLVARSYVQSDSYASDVDNLIMIAPPNKGSSDVYSAWEGGRIPSDWKGKLIMKAYLVWLTLKTSETGNFYETIHNYIPSLKDLMPVYDYVAKAGSGDLLNYQQMHEQNDFLFDLNAKTSLLNERTRFSIILGDKQPTVNSIPVIDSREDGIWIDGKPDPIDPQKNDSGGDGEVLMQSGDVLSAFRDVLSSDHRKIVSDAEPIVAERLSDHLSNIFYSPEIDDEMVVWTDAPADLEIVDPNGKKVSSSDNQIDNSRFAQGTANNFKIVSIPNVTKGKYVVNLKGNTSGSFHIGSEYVDYSGNHGDSSSTKAGTITNNETVSYAINHDPSDQQTPVDQIVFRDSTPPHITFVSPEDGKQYFLNDTVVVSYKVTDDVSSSPNIVSHAYVDGNEIMLGDAIDVAGIGVGEHDFEIEAVDEEGNVATKKITFEIKQDTTPPTISITSPEEGKEYAADEKIAIHFSKSDNASQGSKIDVAMELDGIEISGGSIDCITLSAGGHELILRATDEAGNVSEESVTFDVAEEQQEDKEKPTIVIKNPVEGKEYEIGDTIKISYEITDNISLLNDVITKIFLDDALFEKSEFIPDKEDLGEHIITITAQDEAGNASESSANFKIVEKTSDQAGDAGDGSSNQNNQNSDSNGAGTNTMQDPPQVGTQTNVGSAASQQSSTQVTAHKKAKKKHHKIKRAKQTIIKKSISSVTRKIISSSAPLSSQVVDGMNSDVLGVIDDKNLNQSVVENKSSQTVLRFFAFNDYARALHEKLAALGNLDSSLETLDQRALQNNGEMNSFFLLRIFLVCIFACMFLVSLYWEGNALDFYINKRT